MTKTGWLIIRNSKHAKATFITAEPYLIDHLSKCRKMDTLEDILKNVENQRQHNNTYIHSEKDHNRPSHTVPFIDTVNSYLEAVNYLDNYIETDSSITENVGKTFLSLPIEEMKMTHVGTIDHNPITEKKNIIMTLSEHGIAGLWVNVRDFHPEIITIIT